MGSIQSFLPFVYVTLLVGIITCFISFLNYRQSRKISFLNYQQSKRTWHVNVASVRRKERIDNFITFYSKMVALAHPDTVIGYALKSEYIFVEKIIESYSNLNMLFDHRFDKDTQLSYVLKELTQKAIDYYNKCKNHVPSDEVVLDYKDSYHSSMENIDKLLNLFIGVEWTRIKKEVQEGVPIPSEEWFEQYDKDEKYYEKWYCKYNNK